jgi:hypothetical protein
MLLNKQNPEPRRPKHVLEQLATSQTRRQTKRAPTARALKTPSVFSIGGKWLHAHLQSRNVKNFPASHGKGFPSQMQESF